MSEIKTLKKLEPLEDIFVFRKELKAEAVKWFKHLRMTGEDNVFDFLETFFNLTEEDLK